MNEFAERPARDTSGSEGNAPDRNNWIKPEVLSLDLETAQASVPI